MTPKLKSEIPAAQDSLRALDFFAGCGLVRLGLDSRFRTVWANDNSPKKLAVYEANFGSGVLDYRDVRDVRGSQLPAAELAWASFPCQDLSLAGNLSGIRRGSRSGLFWEWVRVLDELDEAGRRPPVLCVENVVGFLSASGGDHFRAACKALRKRKYAIGAVVVDARLFVPQSRPRSFLIAASEELDLAPFSQTLPTLPFHNAVVVRAAEDRKSTRLNSSHT